MQIEWDFHEFNDFARRLEDTSKFQLFAQQATQEIARELHKMLYETTPVKTGNLAAAWGGSGNYSYTIKKHGTGYSVTLYNRGANEKGFMYGLAVNDGHYSYNQYGGPYKFVAGRFFVESAIIRTCNSTQLENIIMRKLQKWWDSV